MIRAHCVFLLRNDVADPLKTNLLFLSDSELAEFVLFHRDLLHLCEGFDLIWCSEVKISYESMGFGRFVIVVNINKVGEWD